MSVFLSSKELCASQYFGWTKQNCISISYLLFVYCIIILGLHSYKIWGGKLYMQIFGVSVYKNIACSRLSSRFLVVRDERKKEDEWEKKRGKTKARNMLSRFFLSLALFLLTVSSTTESLEQANENTCLNTSLWIKHFWLQVATCTCSTKSTSLFHIKLQYIQCACTCILFHSVEWLKEFNAISVFLNKQKIFL